MCHKNAYPYISNPTNYGRNKNMHTKNTKAISSNTISRFYTKTTTNKTILKESVETINQACFCICFYSLS